MSIDLHKIANSWKIDEQKHEELGKLVWSFITSKITDSEIFPEVTYRTKELLSIIKKIKKKQLQKEYSYDNLNDKLGLRIICSFQEEMEIIDSFIKKYFTTKNIEYKKNDLNFNKLGYISNHYDTSINLETEAFSKHSHLKELTFEIQVRTLNQHCWSNAAHSLSYKNEAPINPILNRKIYRLLSLYEIADDEISDVNKKLSNETNTLELSLLRKLEGKIYKYAKVDYDREISIYTLKILLSYFDEDQKTTINSEISNFINANSSKIESIFDENRIRYYEFPFLTQPEIFIIWFALEKFHFSIIDNWDDNFEHTDLEQIKILWG